MIEEFVGFGGIILGIIIISLVISGIKVVREGETAEIYRLGQRVGTRGTGIIFLLPFIDKAVKTSSKNQVPRH